VAYDHMASKIGSGSGALWSLLLYSAVEAGASERCQVFFGQLRVHAIPSGNDFVNMVRCCAQSHNGAGLDRMLAELSELPRETDAFTWNRALAACASEHGCLALAESLVAHKPCHEAMDTVTYNTFMKCYARAGMLPRCFELHDEMKNRGLQPNEETFGILVDVCVEMGELDKAKQMFEDLYQSGIHMKKVHCTSFIKGLVHARRMDDARAVLSEMARSPACPPDIVTYTTLVKAYVTMGDFAAATEMLQQMSEGGLQPDSFLCNNMLAGCLTHMLKASDVRRVWNKLQGLGMKPTTMTVSIYLNALAQHGEDLGFEFALETLVVPGLICSGVDEVRLFVQPIQACIRGGNSSKALETYLALVRCAQRHEVEGRALDEGLIGLTGRLERYCNTHNASAVGVKLHAIASATGMDRIALPRTESGSTKRRGFLGQKPLPWRVPRSCREIAVR